MWYVMLVRNNTRVTGALNAKRNSWVATESPAADERSNAIRSQSLRQTFHLNITSHVHAFHSHWKRRGWLLHSFWDFNDRFHCSYKVLISLTQTLKMRNRMTELSLRKIRTLDVFVCLAFVSLANSFNIDLQHPVVFRGPEATFFGYSVLEHVHDNTRW